MDPKAAQRNNNIQVLRAIAIIAVVLIHTCPSGEWQVVCRPFINFAVAVFLFLSGYLTRIENNNWGNFYKKRILRVVIPYIIWTVLYSIASKTCTLGTVAFNLLTTSAAPTLYYIFVYIQFVLLTPLLGKLAKSHYRWLGWCIAPVSVIIFKYYPLLTGYEYSTFIKYIWGDSCLGWFTYYYMGLLFGNKILENSYKYSHLFILYFVSIFFNMAESYWLQQLGDSNFGTQVKLSSFLTSSIFLLLICNFLKRQTEVVKLPALKLIGDYSFGIYLSHVMFLRIFYHIPHYHDIPFVINSALVLIVSLAFVYYGNKILGSPYNKWIGFV